MKILLMVFALTVSLHGSELKLKSGEVFFGKDLHNQNVKVTCETNNNQNTCLPSGTETDDERECCSKLSKICGGDAGGWTSCCK